MKAEQLRKSILQLAIQGKLVKQDQNDEPASVLLERIRAEKQRLIKEGKIKKDKGDSIIFKGDDNCYYEKIGSEVKNIDDEIPFEIPDTWCWVRFPQLVCFELGKTPDRHTDKFWNKGIYPWFSIADMRDKKIITETKDKISEIALNEKFNGMLSPQGTLLMSFKLTVGRTSILGVDAVHNEAIISIFPYVNEKNIIRDYLMNTLGLLVNYVEQTDAIKGSTLNSSKLQAMFIPVPPLAEQARIVAEIEKFEPLLSDYDKLEKQAARLDNEIFDKVKKSILQYAIQGKLVEQDENDEPASVLIEHIRAEKKAQLGKKYVESYIYKGDDNYYYEKVGKNEPVLVEDLPFDIPDTWSWTRLKDIVYNNGQKTPTSEFSYVDIGSIDNKRQKLNSVENIISADKAPSRARKIIKFGDILYSTVRPYLHNMCIVDKDFTCEPIASTGFAVLSCEKGIYNQFLFYYMLSPIFDLYANSTENAKGVAYPAINDDRLYKALIPIPPQAEQERICLKIKEILKRIEKDES